MTEQLPAATWLVNTHGEGTGNNKGLPGASSRQQTRVTAAGRSMARRPAATRYPPRIPTTLARTGTAVWPRPLSRASPGLLPSPRRPLPLPPPRRPDAPALQSSLADGRRTNQSMQPTAPAGGVRLDVLPETWLLSSCIGLSGTHHHKLDTESNHTNV